MLTIGISGGLNRVHEDRFNTIPTTFTHDGAAALIEDGRVVAAIEEERVNRIKHSNKFPHQALRHCLDARGIELGAVDRIAYYAQEATCDALLKNLFVNEPSLTQELTARTVIRGALERELGPLASPDRLIFVRHHLAHAMSAVAMSGFDDSIVLMSTASKLPLVAIPTAFSGSETPSTLYVSFNLLMICIFLSKMSKNLLRITCV